MSARAFRVKIERVPIGIALEPEYRDRQWSVYVFGFPHPYHRAYYWTFKEAVDGCADYILQTQARCDHRTGIAIIGGYAYQVLPPQTIAARKLDIEILRSNEQIKSMDDGQRKAQRRKRAARIRAGKKAQAAAEDRLDKIISAVKVREAERFYLTPEDVSIPSTWWRQAQKIREQYLH